MEAPSFDTDQERFWAGHFGKDYIARNRSEQSLAARINLYSRILSRCGPIAGACEFGANIGLNLQAIRWLQPQAELGGIEINREAYAELEARFPEGRFANTSLLDCNPADIGQWDLCFTNVVLIHIPPDRLPQVYDLLYACSQGYIAISEYYNPTPTTVTYRGHEERLFKRDFAGDLLDRFPDLTLVDYGFVYHRDPAFPLDDYTWFLLRKGRPSQ